MLAALWIASAAQFDISLYMANRGTARGGARDVTIERLGLRIDTSQYLAPAPTQLYYSGFAEASVRGDFWDFLSVGLMINSGEVRYLDRTWTMNGRPVLEELRATALVREAYISLYSPKTRWLQVELGRKLWRVGSSYIYDDWGLGAGVSMDFDLLMGKPWRFDLSYIVPSRDWIGAPWRSPLITARVDYSLSLFESVSLSLTYFHDGDGALAEVLRSRLIERALFLPGQVTLRRVLGAEPDVSADLGYVTATATKTIGPGTLKVIGVIQAGRIIVRDELNVAQLGGAFDVSYKWRTTDRLRLTGFVVGQSGHGALQNTTAQQMYNAYVGVLPFITRTSLFFAGGLAETFGARTVTPAGVNGRGVIAPGVEVVYEPVDPLRLRAIAAPLFSWAPGIAQPVGGGGQFYGVELDTFVLYQPWRFLGVQLEGDVWFGGNFFRTNDPIWKVILSTDLSGAFSL